MARTRLTPVQSFNPYKFSVYRNAALNCANGAFLRTSMDAKTFDTGNNVDVVTNQGRFTAPVAGFYHFEFRGETNGGNDEVASLFKNGSEVKRGSRISGAGIYIASTVSGVVQLAIGDYVEPWYYAASSQPFSVGAAYLYFDGFLISAT